MVKYMYESEVCVWRWSMCMKVKYMFKVKCLEQMKFPVLFI